MICVNNKLMFRQESSNIHSLTLVNSCGHVPCVSISLLKEMVGAVPQSSIANGIRARAAVIPAVSLQFNVVSKANGSVKITGGVVSCTMIVCVNGILSFKQASVMLQVLTLV